MPSKIDFKGCYRGDRGQGADGIAEGLDALYGA